MPWGFFTPTHILSLLFVPLFVVAMYYLLRDRSERIKKLVLFPLSLWGVVEIVFRLLYHGSPLEDLPLHLCALNALILPVVVLTGNKIFGNVLLVWCLGAGAALVMNNEMSVFPFFSWRVFFYYWPHLMEFSIPILLVCLKLVKKDPKCILTTVGITILLYTVVHFINLAINRYAAANQIRNAKGDLVRVNYMYSLAANNPLVAWFIKLVPGGYWHMYLAIPIVVVYLLIVYTPELIRNFKRRKTT